MKLLREITWITVEENKLTESTTSREDRLCLKCTD